MSKYFAVSFLFAIVLVFSASAIAQEMPTPTKEHELLMNDVGEWTIKGKMLMPNGFQEFKGKEKVVAIGKFWTVSHYSSDIFGGMTGSCTLGFDPKSKQYKGTWVDSFLPAPTKMSGTYNSEKKTMTFETMGVGMDGKPLPGKIVVVYKDKNSHTFTMKQKDPTGQTDKMVTTMEMVYTRKTK